MSGKVIRLGTVPNNMISTVEDLLAWCKDSKIDAMALCAVTREGDILSAVIAPTALFSLLGAVTDMQRTVTDKIERR